MGNEQSGSVGASEPAPPPSALTQAQQDNAFELENAIKMHISRKYTGDALCKYSALESILGAERYIRERDEAKRLVLEGALPSANEDRAVAALLGLALGDSLGAPLEFSAVRYGVKRIKGLGEPAEIWNSDRTNRFMLKPGQWTDDTAMSLCLADSLIVRAATHALAPLDLRLRFLNWWYAGYNNAFGHDDSRPNRHSVGLGGNISQSMSEFLSFQSEFTHAGDRNTSGNGSLMRLAPAPIAFWRDVAEAEKIAYDQSKTTHQGDEAAECCRLATHIIVRAIREGGIRAVPAGDGAALRALEKFSSDFDSPLASVRHLAAATAEPLAPGENPDAGGLSTRRELQSLVKQAAARGSNLPAGCSPDRDWRWKAADFRYSPKRSFEQPGYIGSYSMDCLAMALHCVASTSSFPEALLKCANMCGDADTVTAVAGQFAGALYGTEEIPKSWLEHLFQWDDGGSIALRGRLLYALRDPDHLVELRAEHERQHSKAPETAVAAPTAGGGHAIAEKQEKEDEGEEGAEDGAVQ